jgi:hypothetical protein
MTKFVKEQTRIQREHILEINSKRDSHLILFVKVYLAKKF